MSYPKTLSPTAPTLDPQAETKPETLKCVLVLEGLAEVWRPLARFSLVAKHVCNELKL